MVKKRKRSVLSKVIDFFLNSQYPAYLVGGVVRDFILNRRTNDIDITVEGNAIKAGYELNRILKGRIEIHKDFNTATITLGDKKIDIAMARKEEYPKPGSLPVVSPSDIYDDLKRRDFTINAIALKLSKTDFVVLDPFKGYNDIKHRIIRILHNKSFVDDPTRIFRALRYKNRLNFALSNDTEELLVDAVSKKMINNVSGQRILNELRLIFSERCYYEIVKDLYIYGIFNFDIERANKLKMISEMRYYYFLSLLDIEYPLSNEERGIVRDFKILNLFIDDLSQVDTNSGLYDILNRFDDRVVKTIPELFPEFKNKVKKYLSLKKIKPFIDGEDLKTLNIKPGSVFKIILKGIYRMQLDGYIKSKKQALEVAKKWVKEY